VVKTLCRRCSVLPVGMCPSCYKEGPEGDVCEDCGVKFQEEVMMGECQYCREMGILGIICDNYKDQCFIFE
jgi:predicted amidophosphoribosyltransferase